MCVSVWSLLPACLQVSISDFLTLFSARTHNGFFWTDRPSPFLAAAAVLSLAISTIVACFWGDGVIDGQHVRGLALKSPESSYTLWALWVWIYCVIWWFIQVGCVCVCVCVRARADSACIVYMSGAC